MSETLADLIVRLSCDVSGLSPLADAAAQFGDLDVKAGSAIDTIDAGKAPAQEFGKAVQNLVEPFTQAEKSAENWVASLNQAIDGQFGPGLKQIGDAAGTLADQVKTASDAFDQFFEQEQKASSSDASGFENQAQTLQDLKGALDDARDEYMSLAAAVQKAQDAGRSVSPEQAAELAQLDEALKKATDDYNQFTDATGKGASQPVIPPNAIPDTDSLGESFRVLGFKSSTALQQMADDAKLAYDTILNSGKASIADLEQAWIAMEEARQKAAIATGDIVTRAERDMLEQAKEALPPFMDLARAFDQLGVTSSESLTNTAAESKAAYDTILNSGRASIADLLKAWISYEEQRQKAAVASGQIITKADSDALEQTKTRLKELTDSLQQLGPQAQQANAGASQLLSTLLQFAGITLTLAGLKKAVEEAFTAFAQVQRAQESLTALTGSSKLAEQEIINLRNLANSEGLSFPALLKADQQMRAFGITTSQLNPLLKAAADAAVATGKNFEQTSSAVERMAAAGMAGGRQLAALGLTSKDLANVLGTTTDKVSGMFKALNESSRIDIIVAALQKFKGIAESTANDLTGSWQQLKNTAEHEFAGVGAQLEPLAASFIRFAAETTRDLSSVAQNIISLGKTFGEISPSVVAGLAEIAIAVAGNPFAALGLSIIQVGLAYRSMRDSQNLATASTQAAAESFLNFQIVSQRTFAAYPDFTAKLNEYNLQLKNGSISQDGYRVKVLALRDELGKLHPELNTVVDSQKSFLQQVQDLKAKLDAGKITQAQYTAELKKLVQAHSDAAEKVRSHVLSLGELIDKNAQLNADLKVAQKTYDEVTARVEKGTASANLQSEALKQLQKAHKALNDTELDAQTINKITEEQAQTLLDKTAAQVTATQQMIDAWGEDDLAVQQSIKARDNLLKQLDMTLADFQALMPIMTAAGQSNVTLAGHVSALGQAFKNMGIQSSDALKQAADQMQSDFQRISQYADKSSGDYRAAQEASIAANQKFRDSLKPFAEDFKTLGITSSQALLDMRDKAQRAFSDMSSGLIDFTTKGSRAFSDLSTSGGKSAGDIYREWNKLLQLNRDYIDSLTGVAEAFKTLHLTSSLELERQAEDAQRAYETIRDSGTASAGDIARAQAAAQEATDKWRNSLTNAGVAIDGLSSAAGRFSGSQNPAMISGLGMLGSALEQDSLKARQLAADLGTIKYGFAGGGTLGPLGGAGSFSDGSTFEAGRTTGQIGTFDMYSPAQPEKGGWVLTWDAASNAEQGGRISMHYVQPYDPNAKAPAGADLTKGFGSDWKNPGATPAAPTKSALSPTVSTPLGIDPTILAAASASATAALANIRDNTGNMLTVLQQIRDGLNIPGGTFNPATSPSIPVPAATQQFYNQQLQSSDQLVTAAKQTNSSIIDTSQMSTDEITNLLSQLMGQGLSLADAAAELGGKVSTSGGAVTSAVQDSTAAAVAGFSRVVDSLGITNTTLADLNASVLQFAPQFAAIGRDNTPLPLLPPTTQIPPMAPAAFGPASPLSDAQIQAQYEALFGNKSPISGTPSIFDSSVSQGTFNVPTPGAPYTPKLTSPVVNIPAGNTFNFPNLTITNRSLIDELAKQVADKLGR